MSRSFKKTPYFGLPKSQFYKRYANKKLRQLHRRHVYLPDGKTFKKILESWSICDFYHVLSLPAFIERESNNTRPSKSDIIQYTQSWFRQYKGK